MNNAKTRIGLMFDRETADLIESGVKKTEAKNRSEFVSDAVKMYSAWLDEQNYEEFFTPALESVIDSKIQGATSKISRNLFRLSVQICIMFHTLAHVYQFEEGLTKELQSSCLNEVKAINGILPLDDIQKIENARYKKWHG